MIYFLEQIYYISLRKCNVKAHKIFPCLEVEYVISHRIRSISFTTRACWPPSGSSFAIHFFFPDFMLVSFVQNCSSHTSIICTTISRIFSLEVFSFCNGDAVSCLLFAGCCYWSNDWKNISKALQILANGFRVSGSHSSVSLQIM